MPLRYERAAKIVLTMLVVQVTTATIISTIMQAPFNPVFRLKAGRVRETDRLEPSASIGFSIARCVCVVKWECRQRQWVRFGFGFTRQLGLGTRSWGWGSHSSLPSSRGSLSRLCCGVCHTDWKNERFPENLRFSSVLCRASLSSRILRSKIESGLAASSVWK